MIKKHFNLKQQLIVVYGLFWLIDGLLQLQLKMFTKHFIYQVVYPASVTQQPEFLADIVKFLARIFLIYPALFNILIVLIQVGIGYLIINKSYRLLGLKLAIIWGLFVWVVGEGLGGLLIGAFDIFFGFPGAALIYVILAIYFLVANQSKSVKIQLIVYLLWPAIWIYSGLRTLMTYSNAQMFSNKIIQANSTSYVFFKHIALNFASIFHQSYANNRYYLILIIGLVEIIIGLSGVFANKYRRINLSILVVFSLLIFIFGEALANFNSGLMTDLNTGPLLIMYGLVFYYDDFNNVLLYLAQTFKKLI